MTSALVKSTWPDVVPMLKAGWTVADAIYGTLPLVTMPRLELFWVPFLVMPTLKIWPALILGSGEDVVACLTSLLRSTRPTATTADMPECDRLGGSLIHSRGH